MAPRRLPSTWDRTLQPSVPRPVKRALRTGYVAAGSLSSAGRLLPDFLVVGGQRCGTTSLFRALEQHPHIVRPTLNKGVNYFDINYHKGPRWYAGHFPRASTRTRRLGVGTPFATFEASGYYLFHPLAAERIARDLPEVKIVAMLRDPAERAFSAWKHEHARGFDDESFERALELEEARVAREAERMAVDPNFQGYSHRHHAYAARGDYVQQLSRYYERLPREQIHVLYSEAFFDDPVGEFRALTTFLGVEDVPGVHFDQHNARGSGPMSEQVRRLLTGRFTGQADELHTLVGRRPPWSGAIAEPS